MLPTPSTSHVAFERIYEPAEDSFLLLDTLSSESEKAFLKETFSSKGSCGVESNHGSLDSNNSPSPLVIEIGTGSGVVISFINAHADVIFGRADILTAGVDINRYACKATNKTVRIAASEKQHHHQQQQQDPAIQRKQTHGTYLGSILGDLFTPLRAGMIDVLVFNPPYVPTKDLPAPPPATWESNNLAPSFEGDSYLLSLSYAGGVDGMETTDRLLDALPVILSKDRGCAYILLCAQNKPDLVKQRIRNWGSEWKVETVGSSGKKAGWEKLQIIRIWRSRA